LDLRRLEVEINIKNHSTGVLAGVTDKNQLKVEAESISQQHFISREFGQAYQVIGDTGTLTSGTNTALHLINNDSNRDLIISYIRVQQVGSTTGGSFDDVGNYFSLGFGRTVSSGGSSTTPVNMNSISGAVSDVVATDSSPTMAGTFSEIDRWYPKASGDDKTYNKEGSVVLGLNDTFEVRHVGTFTDGIAYARVSFFMIDK
jgi:hypothetical protein